MAKAITVDDGLEVDLEAFRKARAVRQRIGAELAGVACPPASAEAAWRIAREAEADAALDLACAVASRMGGA